MKYRRAFTIAAVAVIAAMVKGGEPSDGWCGLAGQSLKEALRRDCTPSALIASPVGEGGIWNAMEQADGVGDAFINRFSSEHLPLPQAPDQPPGGVYVLPLANPSWWEVSSPCRSELTLDLYNLFPADEQVSRFVGTAVPATVDDVEDIYGFLARGIGRYGDGERRCWQPAAGTEGDVARVIMYIVTVYPEGVISFGGAAHGYLDGSDYPALTEAAARQLLAWHRADPVSDVELRRNEIFQRLQGNINPFVSNPELAEYLWGNRKGEGYQDSGGGATDADKVPLRSRYSVADERINLSSPWIDGDAVWTVDGNVVTSGFIIPSQLGAGTHTLRFSSERESGVVLIEIIEP